MCSQAYVSILYLGLPTSFRIVLRGEEVKRRNLAAELKSIVKASHEGTTQQKGKIKWYVHSTKVDTSIQTEVAYYFVPERTYLFMCIFHLFQVIGFLDGAKDDGMDRFCFYHKHRLILVCVKVSCIGKSM
jgi:hypothetical protein